MVVTAEAAKIIKERFGIEFEITSYICANFLKKLLDENSNKEEILKLYEVIII